MDVMPPPAFPEWEMDRPDGKGPAELRVRLRGIVVGHVLVGHRGEILSACSFAAQARGSVSLAQFAFFCSLTWGDAFLEQQVRETRKWVEDQRAFAPAADAVFAEYYGDDTITAASDVAGERIEIEVPGWNDGEIP